MANNEQKVPVDFAKKSSKKSSKKATLSNKDKVLLAAMAVGGVAVAFAVLFNRVKALEAAPAIQVSKKAHAHRMAEAVENLRRKQAAEAATMWEADVGKVKEASEKEASRTIYSKA